jgi:ABC-2 type transport system ATP-binding protein
VIVLDRVAGRRAPLALASVSLRWGPGIHAILGTVADGAPLLLALMAGATKPRSGTIRVLDHAPDDDDVRPAIAYVPLLPALPEALRVDETLDLAASVRGDPVGDAPVRLATLGLEALARRRVGSLAADEAHAVALAEALTSARARVLLLEEPLAGVDPRAAARLPGLLRARAREDGRIIVLATASPRDAGELADDSVLLRAGVVVGHGSSLAGLTPGGARLVVVSSDPQALLSAVAREASVEAVARRDLAVVARGADAAMLAHAVGRAVLASGVDVLEMRLETPSLDEARPAPAPPRSA